VPQPAAIAGELAIAPDHSVAGNNDDNVFFRHSYYPDQEIITLQIRPKRLEGIVYIKPEISYKGVILTPHDLRTANPRASYFIYGPKMAAQVWAQLQSAEADFHGNTLS
jgi:hypothetical protein